MNWYLISSSDTPTSTIIRRKDDKKRKEWWLPGIAVGHAGLVSHRIKDAGKSVFVAGDEGDAAHQKDAGHADDGGHGGGLEVFLSLEGAEHAEAPLARDDARDELRNPHEPCEPCHETPRIDSLLFTAIRPFIVFKKLN